MEGLSGGLVVNEQRVIVPSQRSWMTTKLPPAAMPSNLVDIRMATARIAAAMIIALGVVMASASRLGLATRGMLRRGLRNHGFKAIDQMAAEVIHERARGGARAADAQFTLPRVPPRVLMRVMEFISPR